jgi:hypothetical protein
MLGTTPRRLSWASALGAFGLSAVLLPLTPSWAQKPPETAQAAAFAYEIKDDDPTKPSEAAKSEVRVIVATDGEVEQVQADSLDKAVELIKQKMEALAKQSGGKEQHAAQLKALNEAVADLEKARAKVAGSDGSKGPAKTEERRLYVRRVESGDLAKLTAEKKAQIDKARSRIDGLRKELDEKRQQLTDAQRDLQKLVAAGVTLDVRVGEPRLTIVKQPLRLQADRLGDRVIVKREEPDLKTLGTLPSKAATTLSPSDKERLEHLEKQLAKMLDEVASLKKHEEKAK